MFHRCHKIREGFGDVWIYQKKARACRVRAGRPMPPIHAPPRLNLSVSYCPGQHLHTRLSFHGTTDVHVCYLFVG